jgi:hypothetical protein
MDPTSIVLPMKMNCRFFPLALLGSLAIATFPLQAAFQLVEDFQEIPAGTLNGQRGWTATLAQVKVDPANSSNQVASFAGAGAGGANRPLTIPEGTTATLFFRVYSEADTTLVDWFAGMSDVTVTNLGVFPDFEAQIGYSGSQILDTLRVRDGSTAANEAAGEFLPRTWYKIWAVIDNAADTYEVYIKGGGAPDQTQVAATATGNTAFVFRNSGAGAVANDLIRFFVKSGTDALPGPALLDDIYLAAGKDLSDPVPQVNSPPTVTLTQPANAASFTAPATIPIQANATDPDGTISKVEFFRGATLIGTVSNAPFNLNWTNVTAGFYVLTAKATDNLGGSGTSSGVAVTVNPTGTNNFVLLDDFNNAALGSLNGQHNWTAANATVVVDPTQANNQVASFQGPGGASLAALLPEGRTGTLFLRAYSVADTTAVDWCAGLSDIAAAGPTRTHPDFEAQICVAGAQSLDNLKVRDGTAGMNVDVEEFRPRTWYKLWLVIDNAIDQFEVYMQGGQLAEPTRVVWDEFNFSSFVFRNSGVANATNDLVKFLVLTTTAHTGQFLLDDVYWDQFSRNLSDPAVDPGPLASLRILEIKPDLAAGNVTLRWEGTGPQFQVEKSLAVTGPYQPLGAAQIERVFTDAGALRANSQSFYRVRPVVGGVTPDCKIAVAAGGFVNTPFTNQTGVFSVRFEATPALAPIDSVIGISSGPTNAFSGFAVLARFNPAGNIDARNGGLYAADNVIPYAANVKYQFRLAINVPDHTYSVFVTAPGGVEQTVGTNFSFRTEQAAVTNLNNWAVTVASTTGTNTVCDFRLP